MIPPKRYQLGRLPGRIEKIDVEVGFAKLGFTGLAKEPDDGGA